MDVEKMLQVRDPYGSNRSNRSGKSLSIFKNPNASQTLARDEEVTYTMYGGYGGGGGGMGGDRRSIASSRTAGPRSVGDRSSVVSTTSSKVINNNRVSSGAPEESAPAETNPVELKRFTYHNGVVGNGVENDTATGLQQGGMYTPSSSGGGLENRYSRHSSHAGGSSKAQASSSSVGGSSRATTTTTADRQSRVSAGFDPAELSLNGLNTIELGSGDLDTVTENGGSGYTPGVPSTSATSGGTVTTQVGSTTVTKTTSATVTGPGNVRVVTSGVKSTGQTVKADNAKISHDPRGGERKVGSFMMKPASNWPLERSESNSSAQSASFKTSRDDTQSRRSKPHAVEENGEDGTLADTESINASRTNSIQREGKGKVTRTVSGASGASQKSSLTDNSSIPQEAATHGKYSGKSSRTDSFNSDLSRLVAEQEVLSSSKPVSRTASQTSQRNAAAKGNYEAKGSAPPGSSRSSVISQQGESVDRYMRTIIAPVDTSGSVNINEDTLDRLVREERHRKSQAHSNRSSAVMESSTGRASTTSDSAAPTSTNRGPTIDQYADDTVQATVKRSPNESNPLAKLERMTRDAEGKYITSSERVETRTEQAPAEGMRWFASSGTRNDDGNIDTSSIDSEVVDEGSITAAKRIKHTEADPFSTRSKKPQIKGKSTPSHGTQSESMRNSAQITSIGSTRQNATYNTQQSVSSDQSDSTSTSVSRGSSFQRKDVGKYTTQSSSNEYNISEPASGHKGRVVSPTAAAAKSDEFKSKLSSLMSSSQSGDSSTSSSVAGGKNRNENLSLRVAHDDTHQVQSGDDFPTGSLPRDQSDQLVSSATPTSPIEEVRSQVREGTVGKIKHAFKDINLTGGLAPSTLERKKQTDTSEAESDTGTGPKKFKFVVEGIDVPAPPESAPPESAAVAGTDTSPSTLTRDGEIGTAPRPLSPTSISPVGSPYEFESSEADTLERKSLDRKKRGFSYLLDERLAGEIKRRADTMQSRKPHEAMNAKENIRKSQIREEESGVLKEARANLHHKELFKQIEKRKEPGDQDEENEVIKSARSKLQHRQPKTSESRQMAQPTSPSPIQAHMLLAQKARLQKRSEPNDSSSSTEVDTNEKQLNVHVATPGQKATDPVMSANESKFATKDTRQTVKSSAQSGQAKQDKKTDVQYVRLSANTTRNKDQSSSTTSEKTDIRAPVLRSASVENRNSLTFKAKTGDTMSTPGDKGQSGERHVKQTSQTSTKSQSVPSQIPTKGPQKTASDVDSPDSAYQSDAPVSPAYDFKPVIQPDRMRPPPLQEVEVRHAAAEPVPSTSKDAYQSTHTAVNEVKSSSKVTALNKEGRPESREVQTSKKTQFNSVTQPDVSRGQPQMTTTKSLVTTNKHKQLQDEKVISDHTSRDRQEDARTQPISQQDIINAALAYSPASDKDHSNNIGQPVRVIEPSIDLKQHRPAANQPSAADYTDRKSLPRTSNKPPQAEPVQIKVTPVERRDSNSSQPKPAPVTGKNAPYTFIVPVTLDSTESSPRYVTDGNTRWVQGRPRQDLIEARPRDQQSVTDDDNWGLLNTGERRRPASRQESFNSTSTYTTQSSIGSQRVIPLQALSVQVGSPSGRYPREMKTHPRPPGVQSPTRNSPYVSQPRAASQPRSQPPHSRQNKMRQPKSRSSEGRGRRERSRSRDDHLEVNIYGDEDGDSTPSPHSPPNRYLKVDDGGRSGRVPRYRVKDISVRNGVDNTNEYHSSAELSPRGRPGPHVSNVHVDGDYVDYDSGSAYSEPGRHMGRTAGKYSIQKIMDRRGVNNLTPLDLHPDSLYRKQKIYQVNRDSSFASNRSGLTAPRHPPGHDSTLRSYNTHTMESHRSGGPDVAAVDPDLLGANKTGNDYNVSLKLNAMIGSRPGSKMSWEHDELNQAANVSQYESEYRQANVPDQPGRHVSTVMNYDDYNDWESRQFDPSHGGQGKDDFVVTSVRRATPSNTLASSRSLSRSMTDTRLTDTREMTHHQQFRQVAKPRDRVDIDIELAPEDLAIQTQNVNTQSFQRNTRLRRSKSDPSMAKKFQNSNLEPKFSMTINQTMTMDYTPQEGEEPIDDNNNRRRAPTNERPPRRKPRRPTRAGPYDSESEPLTDENIDPRRQRPVEAPPRSPSDSDETVDEPTLASTNKMNEKAPPAQWTDDEEDGPGDDMPRVLRGSILIKNTIDTAGPARVIDVVDGDDSDDEYLVDDNTNLFDKRFLQSKTNPLYDSDNEDSPERPKRPKFTDIFSKTSMVNGTAPRSSPRKTKSRPRTQQPANGFDETDDYGLDETVSKTTTYNVHAEGGRSRSAKPNREGRSSGREGRSSRTVEQKSEWQINKLLAGAPPDSIKQTINVEREEEEIMGPLPANHADGSSAGPDGLLNFDTVSEKVDLGMLDGKAQVAVKVRCERIVPIRGVDDMFKKSSVIVTRLIEIDLTATDERQRLYEQIMRNQNRPMITSGDGAKTKYKANDRKLSTKETFKLYKTFMGLAEADEAGQGQSGSLQIDRRIDEQKRPDLHAAAENGLPANLEGDDDFGFQQGREFDPMELERQLEDQLPGKASKVPEPDTISYMSAASSVNDILY